MREGEGEIKANESPSEMELFNSGARFDQAEGGSGCCSIVC